MAKENYIEHTEIIAGSDCDQTEMKEITHVKPKFGGFFGFHIWEVCALHQIQGTVPPGTPLPLTYPLPSTSSMPGTVINVPPGTLIGPFSFWGNPLWVGNVPVYNANPPLNPNYPWLNYFYDWVVQQVGPIGIGDKIEFDASAQQAAWPVPAGSGTTHPYSSICTSSLTGVTYTGSTNKICLKYMGVCPGPNTSCWPNSSSFGTNIMTATVTLDGCDCKYFGLDGDAGIAGWDCVSNNNIYEANLMNSPDKCIPRYYPITGAPPQFPTKQDCINSGCGGIVVYPNPNPVLTP